MNIELRWMTSGDAPTIQAASYLFDDDVQRDWAEKFLRQGNHHLCIAFVDEEPAGFVSGIEITHPDKGTEMLLYELGVDEDYRRHGIGRSLAVALRDFAQSRGCTGMIRIRPGDGVTVACSSTSVVIGPVTKALNSVSSDPAPLPSSTAAGASVFQMPLSSGVST